MTLKSRTLTGNDYGEQVESFTEVGPIWAEKKDLRGAERHSASQTVGKTDVVFRIRYRSGLGVLSQLVCDGREYDIQGVVELGRKEGLELYCQARSE